MRARTFAARLALSAGAMAASLLALEVAVRVAMSFDRNHLDALVNPPPADPSRQLQLVHVVQTDADDRIVYRLKPGVHGRFLRKPLDVNSFGFRDPDRAAEKAPGTFRVLGLGDSHTFGWGVAREESYLGVLEALLDERLAHRRFEVWNLAVPGYNTVQEAATLERWADRLSPDLVIVGFVSNDADLPNFLARRPDLWTLRRSYLTELVRRRMALARGERLWALDLKQLRPGDMREQNALAGERTPERYRPLVGVDNMLAAYRRIGALCRARGIPAAVVFTGNDPTGVRTVAEVARESGFVVVKPGRRIRRYLAEHALTTDALRLTARDPHMNALGHRLIAEELFAALKDVGVFGGEAR